MFNRVVEYKTSIFISHRLSSCRFCDKIAVFDHGQIVQHGSHKELVEDKDGKYYSLWRAQAQYYEQDGWVKGKTVSSNTGQRRVVLPRTGKQPWWILTFRHDASIVELIKEAFVMYSNHYRPWEVKFSLEKMIGKNVSIEKIFLTDYLKENEGYSECLGRYSEEGHCDR